MTAIKPTELKKFLVETIEPMRHSIYGNRYRAAARLIDGMYLPCVVFEGRQKRVELALRRFKEVRSNNKEYEHLVDVFLTHPSQIVAYDIKSVELSPFAWPLEILETIHGETTMGWTAFVAEMKDGTKYSYGSAFRFEFFELPSGYSFNDIRQIHSGVVYSEERGLEPFSVNSYKGTVDSYNHSICLREKPFFTCFLEEL